MTNSRPVQRRGHFQQTALLAALCVAVQARSPAMAQSAPETAPAPEVLQEVVVTGSHITSSGFTAPTPMTVVTQERVEELGITNIADALAQLPAFRADVSPNTQQAAGGNIGARELDLRGLGAQRTLVLVDGERFIPSTTIGAVDINLIPSSIIKRTDVVTGGASAAYGSDAVAGVVNFILDKDLSGLKSSVEYGISQHSDDKDLNLSLAYGAQLAAGHLLVAAEYDDNRGMGDCYTRSWCPDQQLVGNSPAGYAGLPASLRVGPDAPGNLTQGGLINTTTGPLRGIDFGSGGTISQYQYGQIFGTNLSPLFTLGGEDTYQNGYLQGILLLPPVRRYNLFAQLDHSFSDNVRGSLNFLFGQEQGTVVGSEARVTSFTISQANPFLPASVLALMQANNIASFPLGRVFGDLGGAVDNSTDQTYRLVGKLEGAISNNWSWDSYYQYAHNVFDQRYSGDVVASYLTNAVNAVTVNGSTLCAANVGTLSAPGCVPFNVFGPNDFSAAARAYVARSGFQTEDTDENVLAANLHGDLLHLPGGPLAVATGVEFRNDEIRGNADALSAANLFWSFNGKAISGRINVGEGYFETTAPLLRDLPLAHLLELNGAIRRTYYDRGSPELPASNTNATTWKLGAVFEPIEELRIRANRSEDIRAPNISELFGPVAASRTTIIDPVNAGQQIQVTDLTGSNPLLKPEKAATWTVGGVLSPDWNWSKTLNVSVDYFDIDLSGAIATLGAQTVVNYCAQGATEFCPFVQRDGNNQLVQVQDVYQNVNEMIDRGIDLEASYTMQIGALGSLDYHFLATHYLEYATRSSIGLLDRGGQTGFRAGTSTGMPDWIVDGLIAWKLAKWSLAVHGKYIPAGIFDAQFVGPGQPGYSPTLASSVSSNAVAGVFYLDLSVTYHALDNLDVYAIIDNALDRNPPLAASAQGGTNQVFFDQVGRYFKVGARLKL